MQAELLLDALARGPAHIRARGGSMSPAILPGARLSLARASHPTLGDVVVVVSGALLIVHRVVGLSARGAVLLKGDACTAADGWFPADEVVAVVTGVVAGEETTPVPPPRPPLPRWRRALSRVRRRFQWHSLASGQPCRTN